MSSIAKGGACGERDSLDEADRGGDAFPVVSAKTGAAGVVEKGL